jgi:hypothetical protein
MKRGSVFGSARVPGATGIDVGLCAVIIAVTDERPRVLTLHGADPVDPAAGMVDLLPDGPLDPAGDRTLELTLRGWVRERAGLELGYVEQLYTFGDQGRLARTPSERGPSDAVARHLSIAYLALVREEPVSLSDHGAHWEDVYRYLPWEDRRRTGTTLFDRTLAPGLNAWIREAPTRTLREVRDERVQVTFGLGDAVWDGDRVLERYELLYAAGLLPEAVRDQGRGGAAVHQGRSMGADHRRILATALGRIRGKIRYRPVIFELVPPQFTLLQLQRTVEALAGIRLHKQNFRRLVERAGLVEGTGTLDERTGGRPAELFRFRREVVRERRTAGVGLPGQ